MTESVGGGAMLGGKEDPRQMPRRLGDGPELVDPADYFIAKH